MLLDLFITMEDFPNFFRIFFKEKRSKWYLKNSRRSKKIREASSAGFEDEGGVFNEGMDSPGCREILFNCLKNLEPKVMELNEQGNENKNMHIKDEKQLVDLAESVKSMTLKFDELEKDRKEKEKIINNFKGKVGYLSEKLGKMEESIDTQQQYPWRNCLLFHGIEETKREDNIALEVLNNDMDLNTSTGKNTVISPNFLVWKFCGKAQFLHSFGPFARNHAETVPLCKISTPAN